MLVVIQCAASKRSDAGHLCLNDGRRVMFVASPSCVPRGDGHVYAHPDGDSDRGTSWRDVLREYNEHHNPSPDNNPDGLLPAWQLYCPPVYKLLADRFGQDQLYILSAGWGLIRADFLTPNYDITFSSAANVASFKRRSPRAIYRDFCLPPSLTAEPIVFFGGKSYVPLFCKLTAAAKSTRIVYYSGSSPSAPGCKLRSFGKPFTNWHYKCAAAFVGAASDSLESEWRRDPSVVNSASPIHRR